jgi:outer membrane protein OmpA-like peptidoglycan-associated protein/TPR repeat protein
MRGRGTAIVVAALAAAAACGGGATGAGVAYPAGAPAPSGNYGENDGSAFNPIHADHDQDGIGDLFDSCPTDGEDGKDPRPFDGCPRYLDPTRLEFSRAREVLHKTVQVTGDKINITEQVRFVTGSANIDPASDRLLANVAQTIKEHPDMELVEVAGHADKTGTEADNKKLTDARAGAVMQRLVANGVAAARLRAMGYGSYCPLDTADTQEAYAKNRRVEFLVLRRDGKNTSLPWGGCPAAQAKGMTIPELPPPAPDTPPAPPQYDLAPDVLFHQCFQQEDDCRVMCAAGSGESCAEVADSYSKSAAEKVAMSERACNLGEAWKYCTDAADAYDKGDGVAKDVARALAIARKGCDDYGEDFSCAAAGSYLQDQGNVPAALVLWRKACSRRVGLACGDLTIYDDGMTKQQKLMTLMNACWFNSATCLGLFETSGDDPPPDLSVLPRDALVAALHAACEQNTGTDPEVDIFAQPCDLSAKAKESSGEWRPPVACAAGDEVTCIDRCLRQGDVRSCLETGVSYLYGIHVPAVRERAQRLLRVACVGKYDPKALMQVDDGFAIDASASLRAEACGLFGTSLVSSTTTPNFDDADGPWKVACRAGDVASCAHDASIQVDEVGLYGDDDDPVHGLATLDKLCNAAPATETSSWACAEASRAVANGYGAPKDAARAKAYRDRACAGGLKAACSR